jgi:hypothetical protein
MVYNTQSYWVDWTDWGLITLDWFRLAFFKGPNRVSVSLPSPEVGNRSSFYYLEFRMMNKVQKPSNFIWFSLYPVKYLPHCELFQTKVIELEPQPYLLNFMKSYSNSRGVLQSSTHFPMHPLLFCTPHLRLISINIVYSISKWYKISL